MNTTLNLHALKQLYDLHAPFWNDWLNYKYCGLNNKDIYVLNQHIKNNFELGADDKLMFYNHESEIIQVTEKLRTNYKDYQEWAIKKFQFAVIKDCLKNEFEINYNKAITELTIDQNLQQILLRFNVNTINELFSNYTDQLFTDKVAFGHILVYMKEHQKLNQLCYASK
jgi:hypothetical protein